VLLWTKSRNHLGNGERRITITAPNPVHIAHVTFEPVIAATAFLGDSQSPPTPVGLV
jgi:hypothetical protein